MAKKLAYERYFWFHNQVKMHQFPNAYKLSEKFEISDKQAQRDIEFIRDRLYAPLIYDQKKKGYYYDDNAYELPPFWLKEEELLSLIIATKLASTIPENESKNSLYNIVETIIENNSSRKVNINDLLSKISVKNIEYYKTDGKIFQLVLSGLFNQKCLEIEYSSPFNKETTVRKIYPLHLLCYMGRWHLFAYCDLRKEIRNFALSRIRSISFTDANIDLPEKLPDIKNYVNRNFGLIINDKQIEVCLEFGEDVAEWISEQIWHESQILECNINGGIRLRFPVSDFRELKGEILKYGSSVKVIYPEELKEEIKKEVDKLKNIYKD